MAWSETTVDGHDKRKKPPKSGRWSSLLTQTARTYFVHFRVFCGNSFTVSILPSCVLLVGLVEKFGGTKIGSESRRFIGEGEPSTDRGVNYLGSVDKNQF